MTPTVAHRVSLGSRIFIGLLLGVGVGLFLGEICAPLKLVGDIFVGLLQMTVLPYIVVTLIANVGRLSIDKGKALIGRGALVWVALLATGIVVLVCLAFAFPDRRTPSFFSASLVAQPPDRDLLGLFIPVNIFASLVNNAVPGVVLFCLLVGAALISIREKDRVIRGLDALGEALAGVNAAVVRLTPYGVFAIAAAAAGTMTIDEFGRLRGYLLIFTLGAVLLTFWVLPALVTACTPFSHREIRRAAHDALVIAFATGKVLVVLPLLIENTQRLFTERAVRDEAVRPSIDVLYPLAYPFPHLGKVIALLFIPFAASFVGRSLELTDYPGLFGLGVVSLFGGPVLTIPFLLETLRLPADMFQLFVISGVYTSRLGDLVGAMNLLAFTVITTCALTGVFRLRWASLGVAVAGGVLLVGVGSYASGTYLDGFKDRYLRSKIIADMHIADGRMARAARILEHPGPNPVPLRPGQSRLDRTRERGILRVGFNDDNLPYAFRNARGELVGLDIEMAHRLAQDLDVDLEFVPFERQTLAQQLAEDHFDIAMSGLIGTVERSEQMRLSRPYLDATFALVVPDYRAHELGTVEEIRHAGALRVGILTRSQFAQTLQRHAPEAEMIVVPSTRWFFEEPNDLDALIISAEAGAAWTILYPRFQVVVPTARKVSMPLVYAMPTDDVALASLVDFWLSFQERIGGVAELYDYWVLGKGVQRREPRWSIARDVLRWIE